jgi:hypothetical protein
MLNRFSPLFSTLTLGFLVATLAAAPGCGAEEEDFNLDSLLAASEDEKADKPQGTSALTWTRVSSSMLNCIRFPCPSTILNDVNAGVTQFVYQLDWRALNLSREDQKSAQDNASKMLLYGRYTPIRVKGEPMRIFQITRANLRVSNSTTDNAETDRYYQLQGIDGQCPQAPCPISWRATLLGRNAQPEAWTGINVKRLQLAPTAEQSLLAELKKGQAYLSVSHMIGEEAQASQAFRPLKAEPLR